MSSRFRAALALLAACAATPSAWGQCEIAVDDTFQPPGVDGTVTAVATFDDGAGPALFVGGVFTSAGAATASRIARWDGRGWSSLGQGVDAQVYALAVYDDGRGPALYAAGAFSQAGGKPANRIARWDGESWEPLGHGPGGIDGTVRALCVFDEDGPGPQRPALFAGGTFQLAGGVDASCVARWDGASWSSLGSGLTHDKHPPNVYALAVHDEDADGPIPPALYAGGLFTHAGGDPISSLARWDGSEWSQVGDGMNGIVLAIASFDRGDDPRLIVGGHMGEAGGLHVDGIAQWNGSEWSGLANGLYAWVTCLTVVDGDADGPGRPTLYLGGYITVASGVYVNNLGSWNGSGFGTVSGGVNGFPSALGAHDDGRGPALVVGGGFATVGVNTAASNIARWRGGWSSLGAGLNGASKVLAFDDGSGPALYAAANVAHANGWSSLGVVRWNGSAWSDVGVPISGRFTRASRLMVVAYPDGVPALFASGTFRFPDGDERAVLARWNGQRWLPLAGPQIGGAADLAVFDDGDGTQLYACGGFTRIGEVDISRVARFNGASWFPVGTGLNDVVHALQVYDDGSGSALFAAGEFTMAGETPVRHVAKWTGDAWSPLADGCPDSVTDLQVHRLPDGSTRLLAAQADGSPVRQWDGTSWTNISPADITPTRLLAHDPDAHGPQPELIYAFAGDYPARGPWLWNGLGWGTLLSPGSGASDGAFFDPDAQGPRPPALFLAGDFTSLNGVSTSSLGSLAISGGPPTLAPLPERLLIATFGSVDVTIEHDPAPNATYRWRRNGVNLNQRDPTIRLSFPTSSSGVYDVVVTTPCGAVISTPMQVQIGCPADWNRSGAVDTADFFLFLDQFFDARADFNRDNTTDSRDFFEFAAAYLEGC